MVSNIISNTGFIITIKDGIAQILNLVNAFLGETIWITSATKQTEHRGVVVGLKEGIVELYSSSSLITEWTIILLYILLAFGLYLMANWQQLMPLLVYRGGEFDDIGLDDPVIIALMFASIGILLYFMFGLPPPPEDEESRKRREALEKRRQILEKQRRARAKAQARR